jgi:hypothetical protein
MWNSTDYREFIPSIYLRKIILAAYKPNYMRVFSPSYQFFSTLTSYHNVQAWAPTIKEYLGLPAQPLFEQDFPCVPRSLTWESILQILLQPEIISQRELETNIVLQDSAKYLITL